MNDTEFFPGFDLHTASIGGHEVVDPASALALMRQTWPNATVLRVLRNGAGLYLALPAL